MKAKFKMMSSILIILLTVLLIAILVSYYNEPVEVMLPNIDNLADANLEINKVISENVSGEVITNATVVSGEIVDMNSGEFVYNNSGEEEETIIKNNVPEKENTPDNDTAVIITSEDTMTNKEKREILTELDNTLMELLDVVDKVQTVDESRLITDEGEVQE